jgi:hypothetical protein
MNTSKTTKQSVPYMFILFIVFLTLKLTGHITWSWWWVTSPLWLGTAVIFAIFIAIILVGLIVASIDVFLNK